jgi:DNA-binding helix-hairpin-helix protein with protein kinase domain
MARNPHQGTRRSHQHDAFGLAVLIFHMLFLGRHPFAGIFRGGTADKTIEDAIREFRFAYDPDKRSTEMEPPPSIPCLRDFPSELGQLFLRAFSREGAGGRRPVAQDWLVPLEGLANNLRTCSANETHHYFKALTSCPWCRVEDAFGRAMFGIKLTIVRGREFDLAAIWAQIESIQGLDFDTAAPLPSDFVNQCAPSTRIFEIKKQRRVNRALSGVSILIAVVIVAPGFIPALPSICILVVGFAIMAKLWGAADNCAAEIVAAYHNAVAAYNAGLTQRANLQKPPAAFDEKKWHLRAEKEELTGLNGVRVQRLAQLRASLWQKQLIRFLEQHRIEDATIPGIGSGRKTLLRCYNIEDASDVISSRLNIKGFGPALKSALLAWRSGVEQRFVFNPNEGIDPADVRALDCELVQRRAKLIQSLSIGAQQLREILLPWQVERVKITSHLTECARQLAQTEVNLKALGRF